MLILISNLYSATTSFTYGNYCGQGHGIYEILNDKECMTRWLTQDDCIFPINELDDICMWHDICFQWSTQTKGFHGNCDCNKAILDADYKFSIPMPLAFNLTSNEIIFDNETMWAVPYVNSTLFDNSYSPVLWAKDYCSKLEEYQTTNLRKDTNIKDVADNSMGKCQAAAFVADQLFPEMSCTCDAKTQIKSKNVPKGGCAELIANPIEDSKPYVDKETSNASQLVSVASIVLTSVIALSSC